MLLSNWLVELEAGSERSDVSCTDQIVVGCPTRFPSFFQSSHELPVLSVKMSGSMLPPSEGEPMMVGAPQPLPSWHTIGCNDVSR